MRCGSSVLVNRDVMRSRGFAVGHFSKLTASFVFLESYRARACKSEKLCLFFEIRDESIDGSMTVERPQVWSFCEAHGLACSCRRCGRELFPVAELHPHVYMLSLSHGLCRC